MAGIGADNFSARWSGQLTPTKSGSYTFTTTTSGGVRLWVNDVLVLDHWAVGSATHTATVTLTAGVATNVRMEYFVTTGTASAQLFWTGPSIAKAVIPSSVMTSVSTGLTGTYFTGTALTAPPTMLRLDRTLNFDWGSGSPDSRVPVDNFAVRWTGKIKPTASASYTFYTDTAGGVRLWVNGQLLVDNWTSALAHDELGEDHPHRWNVVRHPGRVPTGHRRRVGEAVVEHVELRQNDRAAKCAARPLTKGRTPAG